MFTIKAGSVSQAWRRAADRAGILDARFHDVRREAATRLVENFELSVEAAVVFTGHRDLATFKRHYLRLSPETLAKKLSENKYDAQVPSLE